MSSIPLLDQLADAWNVLIGNDVQEPSTRKPMSPASGDVTQTPEPKSTSGLASVFKSLTGNRTKSPSAQSPASAPTVQTQELNPNAFRPGKHAIYGGPPNYKQLYEQLKAGETLSDRLAAADSLRHIVVEYPLSGVMNVWFAGRDLIEPTKPVEARVAGFGLLTACVQHASATDLERKEYFDTLTAPANPQDFHLQLSAVAALAKKGRDLSGFQYEAFPLLNTWLRETFQVTTEARKDAGRKVRATLKAKAPLGEETNLAALFFLIQEVIKFSFNVSTEETTNDLIDVILHICVQTTLASDLRSCIGVIDAIVTYGAIPNKKLLGCVKILCSIHCLVDEVQPEAWQSISNLCRSHDGQTTVRYLLNILRQPNLDGNDEKQTIREIRGALSVLQKLFAKDGEDGYPLVPFTLLMDGLSKVMAVNHARVETDILGLILSIFGDEDHEVMENVMEEDWTVMFNVASKCAKRAFETSDGRPITDRSRMTSPLAGQLMGKDETVGNLASTAMVQILANLINRIEQLLLKNSSGEFFQRNECMNFFVNIYPHLPESCARLVIDYYMEYRMCYPSDSQWKDNIRMMLQAFFSARFQPTHIRLHALKAVTDVFDVVEMMDQEEDPEMVETFVTAILDDIGEEKDVAVLQEVVSFAVAVADTVDDALFNYVIDALRKSVTSDRMSPVGSPPGSRHGLMGSSRPASAASKESVQTPSNVVTKGFIRIFMRNMDTSPTKSLRVFGEMLEIAKSHYYETDARLSALKMLCRLRADWANRIFLTPFTESEGLASSLYRTSASLARKQAIDDASQYTRASRSEESSASRTSRSISISHAHAPGRPPMRTGSGVYRTIQRNHQMWMSPDPDALPEPVSNKASPLLTSIMNSECQATASMTGRMALDVAFYLETITGLLERGCEWEVYSYILVHLASQLSNQALFKAAVPQIRTLRALLCDQLKSPSSFYDPPTSSGLRKVDVGICLYQILTMIMSYHEYFSPLEEDSLVSTFVAGVGTERASKCCIHALSICCHELPRSTSKALPTLLQSMSKIITQSYVAVHILEFLACLARLQNLYSSFRDDDYRTVFAICLRYLEYVRDQSAKEANRNSQSHGRASAHSSDGLRALPENSNAESNFQPNTSDDLPQYVYALAYHVIIFWFLSLKLGDRGGLVTWITKNLISTDSNGKEKIDEQAQVTLDFMQRVAYADVDESAPDPTFTSELFGEILKKTWVVGNSIITVEQATRGDCAQITKRQPSGTSCYTIMEKFTRPPIHQSLVLTEAARGAQEGDANVVLPSHLLLQLTASIPQGGEFSRPIALPNDEKITRAIKSFDRNSTVDGHKVGVIYIGENQTQEVEILANVIGSSDYTQFLTGLGTLTKLKGATFNTQGLDREYNTDGEYTFCWRDRVTEIVFHVTTQMPTNLDHDPQCIGKKRHIGNDFVNIIFNNSGLPFRFDTFPSEFNYVNIVITPESRASFVATRLRSEECMQNAFYKVQVMSKPGFPEISPAAETKIIGLAALPGFIRLLALNASVFSLVWFNREGGEHISSWRNRLREITRLRENYGTKNTNSAPTSPPGTSNGASNIRDSLNSLGRRSSVATFLTNASEQKDQHRSSLLSTAETEVGSGIEGSMQDTLDFSRWA